MNTQTLLILVAVFVGAFHLAKWLILTLAAVYEAVAIKRRHGWYRGVQHVDDVLDLLTVKGWLAPPRRRPSPA